AAFHAWRSDRHAGDCEPKRVWLLRKEPPDGVCGNMSLDDVVMQSGCVARSERVRNPQPPLDGRHVGRVRNARAKSEVVQMLNPADAAAAVRVLVDVEDNGRLGAKRR